MKDKESYRGTVEHRYDGELTSYKIRDEDGNTVDSETTSAEGEERREWKKQVK